MLQPITQAHSDFRLEIVVEDPKDLSQLLDHAVQQLIPAALERRQGILVTHASPDKYIVEVNDGVLCGVIQERRIDPNGHKLWSLGRL